MITEMAILSAIALDLAFGDPRGIFHVVRLMGSVINWLEKRLRPKVKDKNLELIMGRVLAAAVLSIFFLGALGAVLLSKRLGPLYEFIFKSLLGWQLIACRSLKAESMAVYNCLEAGDLDQARTALSEIVGRDTKDLDTEGVCRAAVETVSENASDGVIAPFFYLVLGGVPLAIIYKAVNTMDSMLGYKNERYLYFGRAAAKLDDFFNLIPSRLSALAIIAAAAVIGLDYKNSIKIFKRDRFNHQSPNSAQTESAAAGALNVRLGGGAYYFGVFTKKPFIGDELKKISALDIKTMNRLMYAAFFIAVVIFMAFRLLLGGLIL